MIHRRAVGFGGVALFCSLTLVGLMGGGCSGQRSKASVVLENQSSAALQVEVAVPSRGALGRKPSHEGFLKRLEPGEKWASDADTHHYAMLPNPEQAFRVVVTDIAGRKAAEERLRQASAMFECATEGVVVTDVDAQILLVNQGFCDRTGYTEGDVLGQTPRLLRSGRHDRRFFDAMWACIEAEGVWKGEISNRKKSGEKYTERLVIRAVKDDRARVTHYVGVYSDL